VVFIKIRGFLGFNYVDRDVSRQRIH